jgi:transcriptional antiterminator
MHLVNAGLTGDMAETLIVVRALQGVLAIVQEDLGIAVRHDSPHYVRFLTHLKSVLQRLTAKAQLSGQHEELFEARRRSDPVAYDCARLVAGYVGEEFEVDLSEEEQLYLMMLSRACGSASTLGDGQVPVPASAPTTGVSSHQSNSHAASATGSAATASIPWSV